MGMFNADKKASTNIKQVMVNDTNDSMNNIPAQDLQLENLASSSTLPPTKDGQRKQAAAMGNSFTQQQAIRNQIVQ